MLHVVMMMSQDAVLWFIFELQAALELVYQAVAIVNNCFELILCKLVLFCVCFFFVVFFCFL